MSQTALQYLQHNQAPKLIPFAIDPNSHCGMTPELLHKKRQEIMHIRYD